MALRLSIVVIGFDMKRELPRTVVSLLPPYQQGVHHDEVEIIVVDNGSAEPVCRDWFPEEAAIRVERVKGGVSALGGSYISGVLKVPSETAFCVMKTALFHEINGYDERFVQLGGGLASFDFFRRALEAAGEGFVMLVGEGTFHQLHYGATTQAGGIGRRYDGEASLGDVYTREYEEIVGRPFAFATQVPLLFGRVTHPEVPRLFLRAADHQ